MKKIIMLSRDVAIESIAERILSNPMEYNLHDYVYEYFENKDRDFLQDQHNKMFEIEVLITYTWEEIKKEAINIVINKNIVSKEVMDSLLKHSTFHHFSYLINFLNDLLQKEGLKIYSVNNEFNANDTYYINYM